MDGLAADKNNNGYWESVGIVNFRLFQTKYIIKPK